jgi:hypothetical protein
VADADACHLTHAVVHTDDHSAGHCQVSDGEHYGEELFHLVKLWVFSDIKRNARSFNISEIARRSLAVEV